MLSRNEQLAAIEEELRQTLDELQQSHRLVEENEKKYRALVDALPDALLIHEEGKIVYGNPAACTLFGADPAPALSGYPWSASLGTPPGRTWYHYPKT